MRRHTSALIGLAITVIANAAHAQTHKYDFWEENYTVQALLGAVQYENLKFDAPNSGGNKEVDVSLLPQIGAAWSTMPDLEKRFQVGLECSFLLGVRFSDLNYAYAGAGGTFVSLDVSLWTFDLAGGAYANLFIDEGHKLRAYAGAGPVINYAYYRTSSSFSDTFDDESENESAFGIGAYARAGFEYRIHHRGLLGLGARGTWSTVDLTSVGGQSEMVGTALFASYTAGF